MNHIVDSYERTGTGEPLLLVHGIGSRRQVWDPLVPRLADVRDVITVDLPGFNGARAANVEATVDAYADALATLCADLGLVMPRVAGHSLGGAIALELGRRGLARSVIAFAPIGFWGAAGVLWCTSALRAAHLVGPRLRPALPVIARSKIGRVGVGSLFYGRSGTLSPDIVVADVDAFAKGASFTAACDGFGDHVFRDAAALDSIPVTVVWGTRDVLLPFRSQARRAQIALPNALHVALAGCGHVPFSDDPESCRLLLREEWTGGPTIRPYGYANKHFLV